MLRERRNKKDTSGNDAKVGELEQKVADLNLKFNDYQSKMNEAAARMFQTYENLFAEDQRPTWTKIVTEQTEQAPYTESWRNEYQEQIQKMMKRTSLLR